MPCIAHLASLQEPGGVEAHFSAFIQTARSRYPEWRHVWLNPAGAIHSINREQLERDLDATYDAKRIGGIRLPSIPRTFRARHSRRICKNAGATCGIVWNRTARSEFFLEALGEENVIHWEHGRVWHGGREEERQRYLNRIGLVIANSHAAKRVLELCWNYSGRIHVCLNALRPELIPAEPQIKKLPGGRRVRLGCVARLLPVKGIPLVIHAVSILRDNGFDVELHIAGDGPERNQLKQLTADLNLSSVVRFHGVVGDMPQFYSDIDCLVHLPLTEAFGLVGLEAAVYGCPVIAAAVDGLTESVRDGVSGRCLRPSVPLSEYRRFGSSTFDVPAQVYDPFEDGMRPPALVDPREVAGAVTSLFSDSRSFETMSRTGAERVRREFRFEDHVDSVLGSIESFVQR